MPVVTKMHMAMLAIGNINHLAAEFGNELLDMSLAKMCHGVFRDTTLIPPASNICSVSPTPIRGLVFSAA